MKDSSEMPEPIPAGEVTKSRSLVDSLLRACAVVLALWFVGALYVAVGVHCKLDPFVYFFGSTNASSLCTNETVAVPRAASQATPQKQMAPALSPKLPKWFVLRDHAVGYCWAANLTPVDGVYGHALAQIAGGPYDAEAQALDRVQALGTSGTCQQG